MGTRDCSIFGQFWAIFSHFGPPVVKPPLKPPTNLHEPSTYAPGQTNQMIQIKELFVLTPKMPQNTHFLQSLEKWQFSCKRFKNQLATENLSLRLPSFLTRGRGTPLQQNQTLTPSPLTKPK